MRRYEFVEHTADVAVRAYGADLAEAFAATAEALFGVIAGGGEIRPLRDVRLEAEGIDRDGLLVAFLSQLILVFEVDGMVLTDFEVTLADGHALQARGRGEAFSESRHGGGDQVKGVSYHMMEIEDGGGVRPSRVQVLFDI